MKKIQLVFIFLLMGISAETFAQCNSCNLFGRSSVTVGTTNTYSTSALSGASYFWSATGGLRVSGSNTGRTVRIRAASGTSGKVCVTRYKSGSEPCSRCRTVSITRPCTLNSVTVQRTSSPTCSVVYDFRANTNPALVSGATYQWSASNGTVLSTSGNTARIRGFNFGTNPGTVTVSVTACNKTVTGSGGIGIICIDEPDCGPFPCFSLSPNPTTNSGFTINLDQSNFGKNANGLAKTSTSSSSVLVQLFDTNGREVKSYKPNATSVFIDTQGLTRGMYYVKVTGAKGVQSKPILIK